MVERGRQNRPPRVIQSMDIPAWNLTKATLATALVRIPNNNCHRIGEGNQPFFCDDGWDYQEVSAVLHSTVIAVNLGSPSNQLRKSLKL